MQKNADTKTRAIIVRAEVLASIRHFFVEHRALEIETPCIDPHAVVDRGVSSIALEDAWLRTSPEYAMKNLLAEQKFDIYQLGRVFRDDVAGRFHRREFTMLEWYRVGWDEHQLMRETETLLRHIIEPYRGLGETAYIQWDDLFATLDIDIASASDEQLIAHCHKLGWHQCEQAAEALDFLTTKAVEKLSRERLTFIYRYPLELSQLAKASGRHAARFEVFVGAMELVNGCSELTDLEECQRRCRIENKHRPRDEGVNPELLYRALKTGLPECAGAALGVDRLLMYVLDANHIGSVCAL